MIASCGGANLCHGADAVGERRRGVPVGLELDVRLASTTSEADDAELARLRRGRDLVVQHAGSILRTLDLGAMPPAAIEPDELSASYLSASGAPLPPIRSPEAREVLRNWLACGAPVVERTSAHPEGAPRVVVPRADVPPIQPTWASIFRDVLVARRCGNRYCHGDATSDAVGLHVDATDCDATYDALVGARASGEHCGDGPSTRTLVTPGDAASSVFLDKLTPESGVCGDPMAALRPEDLDAIRAWIEDGAPRCASPPCGPSACADELGMTGD